MSRFGQRSRLSISNVNTGQISSWLNSTSYSIVFDFLVAAGGGGGGGVFTYQEGAGGGGAGGLRSSLAATGGTGSAENALALSSNTSFLVTVGAGGSVSYTHLTLPTNARV